ncbi:hypothetical protein [Fervidibacillus halotolerans]|uniref:Uncharacterized protein n=1 Tax=Fervidibacillus halotolerans TaxID=2980027 RepID=A0A9E8RZK0_9BACI|nr:hypothetical protein [Fervidibacillus halotolerans]WAA11717.1 hypothetical protein OE105_08790 [Fervidibacillus halotolerans]
MDLFHEGDTIQNIHNKLIAQIPKYRLLGDIPISQNDYKYLATKIKDLYSDWNYRRFQYIYEECISVFLVFCAVYEYNQGVFWKKVEKYVGELGNNSRINLFNIFSKVLSKYHLHHFENEGEEGYTYVTPILCHAGIPIKALNNYFEAISNTVEDIFYDDFDVEDYLSYLKNKTEITVKRYLKFLEQRDAYNFIQNTKKMIVHDSIDYDELENTGNNIRLIEQISIWKEKPKVKKSLQARKNVRIIAPKIKVDLEGVGVYCELPRIIVKESYDSYLIWEITIDETTFFVKADFLIRKDVLISEEKIYSLRPAKTYIVTLKLDDQIISKWEIEGIKNFYIVFDQNGNLIKKQVLPNQSIILFIKNNIRILNIHDIPVVELPQIPHWNDFNIYNIDLTNIESLHCTHNIIPVRSEKKPILVGGKTLFHQENSKTFTELPRIKVPILTKGDWHLEIKHRIGNSVLNKKNITVECFNAMIFLDQYIEEDCFGEYEIKIWHRSGVNERLLFEFVPDSKFIINPAEYWPSYLNGYSSKIYTIRTRKNVELEFFNAENVNEINKRKFIDHIIKINKYDRFLIGEYKYLFNGNIFKTSIKINVLPIVWGIMEDENEVIEYTNKVYTFTLQELSNFRNPYLLFAFGFINLNDIQRLKIELVDNEQKILLQNEIFIVGKEGLRIPLNTYLFEIQNNTYTSTLDFHLRISLVNSKEKIVTTFIVARFQNEIIIKNCKYNKHDDEIVIYWEEEGPMRGREIVMVNFLKPWLPPYHFKVEDKLTVATIRTDFLAPGIYKYLIQKESENLFFEEEESEVCTLNNFQRGLIKVKGEKKELSPVEIILSDIMKSRFLKPEIRHKRLSKIKNKIKNIDVNPSEDLDRLSNIYILYDRFFSKKDSKSMMSKIINSIFDKFIFEKNISFRYVLDSNFTIFYKKQLLYKFYCINLTFKPKLNDVQLKMLAKVDEDLFGFINLFQTEFNIVGLNWAGISDFSVLIKEDLFNSSKETFLSDENFGKPYYITKYFQFVYQSLQLPRNLGKSTANFIKEFQDQYSVQETKIFGKTRLQLVVEWREHNTKDLKQVQQILSNVLKITCESKLKNQFKEVFQMISKRKKDDEIGYFIGLIALYASFIRNGLMEETKEISQLIRYTIEKCKKLYYRDAIIIELYMKKEAGYEWV